MPPRTALEALMQRPWAFLRSSWPWRSLAYLLVGAPLGAIPLGVFAAAYRYGVVVGLTAGIVAAMLLGPLVARFERTRLRLVDRVPVPSPGPRPPLTTRLRDPVTWREYGFILISMLTLWILDLALVLTSAWVPLILMSGPFQPGVDPRSGLPLALLGVALLPLAAYPTTAWAGARAMIARAVFAPGEAEIIRSRARLVDAFENERRRIERDLHDGAQQRLVSLTMKLGLARLDLAPGSPAEAQIAEAHEEAKQALAELRELIRGVHPQVLTNRGLAAAVQDVAGRSPVPVRVDIDLAARLPVTVEVVAYYVVCEALTNVARHSGACRSSVRARHRDGALHLEIDDDGRGGAVPGTGLAGLADRVSVVDGVMKLSSPQGGPTSLQVEIPCPVSA
ncbi:sensor histidine kinase [Rhizohabitans arisaemae]|uniref:sensor histidine kinase n=1 Tax=Rhizohabitans arisaemae TaxID=2720610 RepID=UPI0024B20C13|nr:sensor domain-containing protein [Rhizohabitans arisaemae]